MHKAGEKEVRSSRTSRSRWAEEDADQSQSHRRQKSRHGDDGKANRRDTATSHSNEEATERRRQTSRSNETRRRSHSPDFERDRARERRAYDERHGLTRAHQFDDRQPSQPSPPSPPLPQEEHEPNFGSSGLLARESNSKNGITLKYFEPPEARKPKKKWRLYVFDGNGKGKETDMLQLAQQSCYLLGRDEAVADIHVPHISVSKQHAVLQFRSITIRNEYGDEQRSTKPFLIDLDSANGSFVNAKQIPSSRFYELKTGDTLTFGGCECEYVLLKED